ncbi:hypothetical protein BHE74_00036763 [Ensete ventricosum]|nr:hypothetical protein BHE74_00036763 [Ensete ventricosum]
MRLLEFPCGRRAIRLDGGGAGAREGECERRGWVGAARVSWVGSSEDAALMGDKPAPKGDAGPRKAKAQATRRFVQRPFKDDDG